MTLVLNSNGIIEKLARSKKKVDRDDNVFFSDKYVKCGFVPFTMDIYIGDNGKKKLRNCPKHGSINKTNYAQFVSNQHNAMAIKTGLQYGNNDDYFYVLIDVDDKNEDGKYNGLKKWNEMLEDQNEINTPTQKTGNKGLHYLFKVTKNVFEKLPCSITDMMIDGKIYTIDFKGSNQFMLVEPTKYANKTYKWATNFTEDLEEMPKWILNILMKQKEVINKASKLIKNVSIQIKNNNFDTQKNITKKSSKAVSSPIKNKTTMKKSTKNKIEIDFDSEDSFELEKNDIIDLDKDYLEKDNSGHDSNCDEFEDDIEKILDILSDDRVNNRNKWIEVGFALYNATKGHGLSYWTTWSKKSPKYDKTECMKLWPGFKNNKNNSDILTMGSIKYWCKEDNPERYNEYVIKQKTNQIIIKKYPDMNLELGNTITVNNKKCTFLNNRDCVFIQKEHKGLEKPMFVEITNDIMEIRCRHDDCIGKTCPYPSIRLTKNEINYCGVVNLTINNYNSTTDELLIEFQKYDIFENNDVNELVYKSLKENNDATFADIIYYYYKDKYTCGEDDEIYIFDKHKWSCAGKESREFSLEIEKKLSSIYDELIAFGKRERIGDDKIKKFEKIKATFGRVKPIKDIKTTTKTRLKVYNNPNNDFVKNLNSNRYIIVFDNGVYDLEKQKFREGKQSDNMTMSVNYAYNNKYSKNVGELIKFLSDIQPEEKEREFLLTYISLALCRNILDWFTILTGDGRNGKSKLIELITKTFGELCGTVPSQLFTRPRPAANSPDPGLLNLRHKKIVIAGEPEKREKLNSGFIKFITGQDSIELRECHKNEMISFAPKFLTLFMCNDIPETDEIDNAFCKRLKCVNFPTEFCDKPTKENQKLIDTRINEKFDNWRSDFMLLLIEYYKKYSVSKTIQITDNILKWTNQYKANTDIYLEFLSANIVEDTDKDSRLHCSTMYNKFKIWFKDNNPGVANIPSNKAFCNNLRKHKIVKDIRIGNKSQIGIENVKFKNDNIKNETIEKDNVKIVRLIK
jgi:P4 family phage/plasmid primase-like protien